MHPNTGPLMYPCSVCFKNVTSQGISYMCTRCSHYSHWVHLRCSGLRNVADYRRANGLICTACRTSRTPSPSPSHAHTPAMSDKTANTNIQHIQYSTSQIYHIRSSPEMWRTLHSLALVHLDITRFMGGSGSHPAGPHGRLVQKREIVLNCIILHGERLLGKLGACLSLLIVIFFIQLIILYLLMFKWKKKIWNVFTLVKSISLSSIQRVVFLHLVRIIVICVINIRLCLKCLDQISPL